MQFSEHEMDLFAAACANQENTHAQELLNVFGAEYAVHVLEQMPYVPLGIVMDVMSHLWRALSYEAQRRGGEALTWLGEPAEKGTGERT